MRLKDRLGVFGKGVLIELRLKPRLSPDEVCAIPSFPQRAREGLRGTLNVGLG